MIQNAADLLNKARKQKEKQKDEEKLESNHVSQVTEELFEAHEILVFDSEELKCNEIGICYGCGQGGHYRRNCPNTRNRTGRSRQFMKKCFNCGQGGHHWRSCNKETMKINLMKYAQKREYRDVLKRYNMDGTARKDSSPREPGKKASQNHQVNAAQTSDENYASEYMTDDSEVLDGNVVNLIEEDDDLDYGRVINVRKFYPQSSNNEEEQVLATNVLNLIEEPSGNSESMNANKVKLEKEPRAARQKIYFKKGSEEWKLIPGMPDTGADVTCGSIREHSKYCLKTWDFVGPRTSLRTADKTRHRVRKEGIINMKVGDKELGLVRILLVNSKQWSGLLVGLDLMRKHGIQA